LQAYTKIQLRTAELNNKAMTDSRRAKPILHKQLQRAAPKLSLKLLELHNNTYRIILQLHFTHTSS